MASTSTQVGPQPRPEQGVSERPRVLVTDAQERWTVATCRSLDAAGYRVTAAADFHPAVAHWSRHCHERLLVPIPWADPAAFVDALAAELERRPYAALLAAGDASLMAVSHHRELLAGKLEYGLGLPPQTAVDAATDKVSLAEAAAEAELDCPPTIVCADVDEALEAAEEFGYPVVMKPRRSVYEVGGVVRREGSRMAGDPQRVAQLVELFGESCLVQPRLEGIVHSCSGVFADGRMLAFCLARYDRTWPPDAGNAALSETIEPPPGLAERIGQLIARLGWKGIFELELVRDPAGRWSAIDLNPRLYGSLALALAAGADLPAVWCAALAGDAPAQLAVARAGFRYRWEDAEARRVVWSLRHGDVRDAAIVARPRRRVVHPHFRYDDPGPMVARVIYLVRRTAARVVGRRTLSGSAGAPIELADLSSPRQIP